jgi:hypothetical protein
VGQRELTIREAPYLFCQSEIGRQDERRIEMSIGLARFPFVRDLDGFDLAARPWLDKKQIRKIACGGLTATLDASAAVRLPITPCPIFQGATPRTIV